MVKQFSADVGKIWSLSKFEVGEPTRFFQPYCNVKLVVHAKHFEDCRILYDDGWHASCHYEAIQRVTYFIMRLYCGRVDEPVPLQVNSARIANAPHCCFYDTFAFTESTFQHRIFRHFIKIKFVLKKQPHGRGGSRKSNKIVGSEQCHCSVR